jgi:hypothetical protein
LRRNRNILAAALWSMAAMMAAAATDPSREPNDGVEDKRGVGVGSGKLEQAFHHIVQPLPPLFGVINTT